MNRPTHDSGSPCRENLRTARESFSTNQPVPFPPFWSLPPKLSHRSFRRKWYRDFVYRGIYLMARLVLRLGPERSVKLAARIGEWGFLVQRRERKRALENLRNCLGNELNDSQRREIARKVFANAAISTVETIWMSRWEELMEWLEYEVEGRENLEQAVRMGKGVLCINAHFGNWEVMSAVVAQFGHPAYIIARELKDPRLDQWVQQVRRSCGIGVLVRGRTPFRMIRLLREGAILGVMIDLDTRSGKGMFVDFFGRPAYTQTGPFELARRTGASIVPSLCYREGLNRLRLTFGEPWHVVPTGDPEGDIRRATERATRYLEEKIRERPEQWMWFHNRWKTTPEKVSNRLRHPVPETAGPSQT